MERARRRRPEARSFSLLFRVFVDELTNLLAGYAASIRRSLDLLNAQSSVSALKIETTPIFFPGHQGMGRSNSEIFP